MNFIKGSKKSMLSLDYIFGILIAVVVSFFVIMMVYSFYSQGHWIPIPVPQGHNGGSWVNNVIYVNSCDGLNTTLQNEIWKCYEFITGENNSSNSDMSVFNNGVFCGAIAYTQTGTPTSCDENKINQILNQLDTNLRRKGVDWDIYIKATGKDHKFIILFDGKGFEVY
ncbi:MAG: hypothetical protein GWP09_02875 [Nitrospiraceae bacterium]|nr:hypothetical protein [Nitrospiraceae bacterium]